MNQINHHYLQFTDPRMCLDFMYFTNFNLFLLQYLRVMWFQTCHTLKDHCLFVDNFTRWFALTISLRCKIIKLCKGKNVNTNKANKVRWWFRSTNCFSFPYKYMFYYNRSKLHCVKTRRTWFWWPMFLCALQLTTIKMANGFNEFRVQKIEWNTHELFVS